MYASGLSGTGLTANVVIDKCTFNYFNALGFYDPDHYSGSKVGASRNYTILDSGFTDAENGDFTLSNQTLIDDEAGDPRWY